MDALDTKKTKNNTAQKGRGKVYYPHDAFFKSSMSDLKIATAFLHNHLPHSILEHINLGTLRIDFFCSFGPIGFIVFKFFMTKSWTR